MADKTRPLIGEVVRKNAEENARTKAEYPPDWVEGHALTAAEGGFRKGDRVKVIDPDDFYCGKIGVCGEVLTERTVFVALDGHTFRWCVGALAPA